LFEAWKYSMEDLVLNVMPLHHMHGILTALLAPLFSGSTIELHHPFDPMAVLKRFGRPYLVPFGTRDAKVTVFTAVPTMYSLMIDTYRRLSSTEQTAVTKSLSQDVLRLNICGSAALPAPLTRGWDQISNGNTLLQRYGMTEAGMALSCGLSFKDRVDGSVGWPLPLVQVRLVDVETQQVIEDGAPNGISQRTGEIQLRGPTIFTEYWCNPSATKSEFVPASDGRGPWFRTGDIAERRSVNEAGVHDSVSSWACGPMYFIHGRSNVDILKAGGEKVSALEVERELLAL
jgi:malonyl-CoA/methylmalonyl-CoA synthetase